MTLVVILHIAIVMFMFAPSTRKHEKSAIMEVVLLEQPKTLKQEAVITPTPPQPKIEAIKPKPPIKPPVKKSAVKPISEPKITEPQETLPTAKAEPSPPIVASDAPPQISTPSNATPPTKSSDAVVREQDNKTVVSGIVPLVRVPPKYPARAAGRHIEGWVKVEFTIQTDGSVENPIVVSAEPEGTFDDAALTAISKWKFKEKLINGVAVTQRAMQTLQFKLE